MKAGVMNSTPESTEKWLMETERLRLRPVTVDDATLMLAIWNDPAFIKNVADRGIRTVEEAREAIEGGVQKLFEEYGYGPYCMSLKSDGGMIGICGLFKRDNLEDPDIGFAALPDYCGKGYTGEAAMAVVEYARDTLDIAVLTAIVSPANTPSIGLIEKLGLQSTVHIVGDCRDMAAAYKLSDVVVSASTEPEAFPN